MDIQLVNTDKQRALEEVLAVHLDEYRPELEACIGIRGMSRADVEAVVLRTELYLNNLKEILEDW